MEYVVIVLIEIIMFPLVYISADKWHRIAERCKKMVER